MPDSTKLEVGPCNVYLYEGAQDVDLGYMGDALVVAMSTEAVPLTGAQKGTVPLDKVVTGGSFRVTVPFKEIKPKNFSRAFPNAVFVGTEGAVERVDFKPRVGLSLRAQAKKLTLKKIIGGVESTSKSDHIVIPLASAVDAEVSVTFSPTEQRVINATFEAWPDDATGRWAYMGDELAS